MKSFPHRPLGRFPGGHGIALGAAALMMLIPAPLAAGGGVEDAPAARIEIAGGSESRRSAESGGDSTLNPAAQLHVRLGEIEAAIAQLRGSMEEILFRLDQLEKTPAQGNLPARTDTALIDPPPSLLPAPENEAADEDAAAPAEEALLVGQTPRERYDHAMGVLLDKDYPRAERALRAFIQTHGDDPLADNAHYWIAETHYVRGNFSRAATLFAQAYKKDPQGAKAPDNLLKLAFSLDGMKDTKQACEVLGEIGRKFPKADENLLARAKNRRQALDCPG